MNDFEDKAPIPTRRKELRKINLEREDYKHAYDFAGKVYKKFGPLVLSVVVFGSVTKREAKPESDIDIIIIIDNVSQLWDEEVVAYYREELFKITKSHIARDRLHINTITLSNFWDNVRVGDPAVMNMLRYGVALVDLGFFEPLKYLLLLGRISPTPESIYVAMNKLPWHFLRARVKILSAVEDLYWAMVDSSHAALMMIGHIPPSPEHVPQMLEDAFVKKKKLKSIYVGWYKEMYEFYHDIKNHKIAQISGTEYDKWLLKTSKFVDELEALAKKEEKNFFKKK
ncbi:MAG: nucleotidyltransferase domain-containing protein [DPANN group archaeon]|nr:nucleotidyltransferase domain-containing protein [DPANN group archaeon]